MEMGEAYQHIVRVVIGGTPIPTFEFITGTELDRTEWYIGAHEYVAMTAGTNQWVDILC